MEGIWLNVLAAWMERKGHTIEVWRAISVESRGEPDWILSGIELEQKKSQSGPEVTANGLSHRTRTKR